MIKTFLLIIILFRRYFAHELYCAHHDEPSLREHISGIMDLRFVFFQKFVQVKLDLVAKVCIQLES